MLSLSVKMVGPFITSSQNQIGSLSDIRSSGCLYPKGTYSSSEFFALILHQTIGESAIIYSSQLSQFFALYFSFPKVRKCLQHICSQVRLPLKMVANFDVLTREFIPKNICFSYSYIESKIFVSFKWMVFFCFVRMRAHGGASWCIILYAGNYVLLIVLTFKVCSISCFNSHEKWSNPQDIFENSKITPKSLKVVVVNHSFGSSLSLGQTRISKLSSDSPPFYHESVSKKLLLVSLPGHLTSPSIPCLEKRMNSIITLRMTFPF